MNALLWCAAVAGWLAFGFVTVRYLVITLERAEAQPFFIHFDWHAYAAGAHDLADRTLYRVPLELGDRPLPLDTFNLPPLAAAEAAVLLPLGLTLGGLVWQVVGALAIAFAATSLPRLAGLGWWRSLALGGVILGGYMLVDHVAVPDEQSYWWGLVLGTNNYLVLGVLAAFALALRAGRLRLAGVALGIAIATKLWPATLLVALLRGRRWEAIAWALGVAAVQGLVWLAWLGPDAVRPGLEALGQADQEPSGVIGLSALRDHLDWLPSWAGWAVAAVLLALPIGGEAGLGLGVLAGLAPITNLWGHYLPTILFAAGVGAVTLGQRLREWRTTSDARLAADP